MKSDKNLTQNSYFLPDFQFMGIIWEKYNYSPKILNKKVFLEFISTIFKILPFVLS